MRRLLILMIPVVLTGCVVVGPGILSPNPNLAPTNGTIVSSGGFVHTVAVQAGGPASASAVGASCIGEVSQAPNVNLDYRTLSGGPGIVPLAISTQAGADTTLVVQAPNGTWFCDDDGAGFPNARLVFNSPSPGVYHIWVGTFAGGTAPATLRIN